MSAGFFYFSFVDESRPEGDRFVGATVIDGADAVQALEAARSMGLVPQGAQVAMAELWTQDESPQRRITTVEMLPTEAREMLWARRASAEEVRRGGGSRPMKEEDITTFVCKDHANPK